MTFSALQPENVKEMETKSIYSTQILFLSKIQQKSKFQILKITKSYLEGYYEEKIW